MCGKTLQMGEKGVTQRGGHIRQNKISGYKKGTEGVHLETRDYLRIQDCLRRGELLEKS